MPTEQAPKILEEMLPEGSKGFITVPAAMTDPSNLPPAMSGLLLNTDIVRIDALNAPTQDCALQPNGYCLIATNTFYVGPTLISCQPPFAYIRWTQKKACV